MKAIGVQVSEPVIERNFVRLFHIKRARAHDDATIKVLVMFLHIWRLRVFGQEPNK